MDSVPFNFFLLLILVFISSSLAQTNGTIPVRTSLTATQNSTPWLSSSADFAFGFLPQNDLFLLSIWYYNLPEKTIVWHANDGNLVPSGSTLELNTQNGLVLTDPQGTPLWSALPIPARIDHGFFNNTGNFILVGSNSSILWESFKNPTDTLLPAQTMEIGGVLNSRISDTNFSQGRFQFRMLEDGSAVLNPRDVLTNYAYDAYYQSDTNDASNSSNSGSKLVFDQTGNMFIVRRSGQISVLRNQSVLTWSPDNYYRVTLHFDGVFVMYCRPKRSSSEQNWTAIRTQPDNICFDIIPSGTSGACGYNNICKLDINRRPLCECPLGFSLLDPNDKYGSCKPSFVQSCDENGPNLGKDLYILKEQSKINWPFNDYERNYPISIEGCRNSCLNDCFCAVAIYNPGSGCWKKKLPLTNGISYATVDETVLWKLKKGDFPEKGPFSSDRIPGPRKKQGILIFAVSLLLGSSVFINFVLLGVGFSHINKKKIAKPMAGNNNIVETNLRAFSYEELVQATNGFKDELGRGAFSLVYKGVIDIGGTGSNVAIKKLDRVVQDGEKEFRAELNYLSVGANEREILTDWVWDCFQEGKLEALVEDDVEALNNTMIFERFVMVGIWCIQEDPFLRPSMRKVIQMLEGVVEVTPPPCPSPFSTITMGSEK
ncbi:hypothetical protein LguiB_001582 [Lonicera macranthoides]